MKPRSLLDKPMELPTGFRKFADDYRRAWQLALLVNGAIRVDPDGTCSVVNRYGEAVTGFGGCQCGEVEP